MNPLRKFLRAARTYGVRRAIVKSAGRLNLHVPLVVRGPEKECDISLIGCGQFGFASICYFLAQNLGNRFRLCFDVNPTSAERVRTAFRFEGVASSAEEIISDERSRYIYIASNHATHAPYAVEALRAGKFVHIEKPVAVSWPQLRDLVKTVEITGNVPTVGYNRPFAPAITELVNSLSAASSPVTFSCIVAGHILPQVHWYRNPEEGTRICGNLGHWLDLAIHILAIGEIADRWTLHVVRSDPNDSVGENISVALTSSKGDLVSIVLTARLDPPDGVHEVILVQKDDVMARIDDFEVMTLWQGASRTKILTRRKDVGHEAAILQQFRLDRAMHAIRWHNTVMSSLWMLSLADMVRTGALLREFSFSEALAGVLESDASSPIRN